MAVSRKAMTEGIRTPTFLGTLNKARFDNPSVKNRRFLPAPFTQGSRGCSRASAFFGNRMPPVTIRSPKPSLGGRWHGIAVTDEGKEYFPA